MATCCTNCGEGWRDEEGVRPGSDCPECGSTVHPLPGTELEPARDTPDELWLPTERGTGECYHAVKCGAHSLEPVPFGEAVARVMAESLEPCGTCERYHGLDVSVGRR